MLFDMKKFDEYREDNRREVKKAKSGLPNSLWETYSAFANCYGGVIILGVSENEDGSWQMTGLENERKLLKEFWDTINNKSKVSHNLLTDKDVETFIDDASGHVIMTIFVPAAKREEKPIYLNGDLLGRTFRRNWEGDYRCSEQEVKAMLRDQPNVSADMKVIETLTVDQLNKDTIQRYRNRHKLMRPGHIWSTLDNENYLEMIGAAAIGNILRRLDCLCSGMNIALYVSFPNIFWTTAKCLIQLFDGQTAFTPVRENGVGIYLISILVSTTASQKT